MNRWLAYTKKPEPEKEDTPPPPKILSGTVYSHPFEKKIYFESEYDNPIAPYIPVDKTVPGWDIFPPGPFKKYKDERRNWILNSIWQRYKDLGVLDALRHEEAFRAAKVRLAVDFPAWDMPLSAGTPGIMYHKSFIDLFPEKARSVMLQKHEEGFVLVIAKKMPWMIKKDSLVLDVPEKGEYELF